MKTIIFEIPLFFGPPCMYVQTCMTSTECELELSATAVIIEDEDDDDDEDSVMLYEDRMIRITVTRDWDMAPSVPSLAFAGHRSRHTGHIVTVHTPRPLSLLKLSTAVATTGSPCQLRCGPGL